MTKTNDAAQSFLQKTKKEPNGDFKESFELTKPAAMSGFHGMFGEAHLSDQEEREIQHILHEHYQPGIIEEESVSEDCHTLTQLTAEIKAISRQSILLHGERIKKAQDLLRNYKDGAFSAWLMTTYGNRQTPYSMLQYFEFYSKLPHNVRPKIEAMPKKAAYTLASRDGNLERKLEIIQNYQGENQRDVILLIQETFPCKETDKRRSKPLQVAIVDELETLIKKLEKRVSKLTDDERNRLSRLSQRFSEMVLQTIS